MSLEVLVIAAHDGALLDELGSIMHRAIQASDSNVDVVFSLSDNGRDSHLQGQQLLLWRESCPTSNLITLVHGEAQRSRSNSLTVSPVNDPTIETAQLLKTIHKRDKRIKSMHVQVETLTAELETALAKATLLESEQEQFFEDVQKMKQEYDKLQDSHHKLLWEYLPSRDPELQALPKMVREIEETEQSIGSYHFEQVLGHGQYAIVYASTSQDQSPLAIKAIDKEKLIDLVALHRVNCEIASLCDQTIKHHGILSIKEVIHTKSHIYLITDRGGKDLFEFFGVRTKGLEEKIIKPLAQHVAQAVAMLHKQLYCHRDLKPENILYNPEHPEEAEQVKLVDFGLCTKLGKDMNGQVQLLHDFCGSPGFFAPEILLQDMYDGQKADVWSLGCVLLEMILGNTMFDTLWMSIYEFETLKEHSKFKSLVQKSLDAIREYCDSPEWTYSSSLKHLLLQILCEDPMKRITMEEMLQHPWFVGDRSVSRLGTATDLPEIDLSRAHHSPIRPLTNTSPTRPPQIVIPTAQSPPRKLLQPVHPVSEVTSHIGDGAHHLGETPPHHLAPLQTNPRPVSADNVADPHSPTRGHGCRFGHANSLTSISPPVSPSGISCAFNDFSTSPRSPSKVSLPSIGSVSPEKPTSNRSPEKSFRSSSSCCKSSEQERSPT